MIDHHLAVGIEDEDLGSAADGGPRRDGHHAPREHHDLAEAGAPDEARSYVEQALRREPRNRQALDMLAALAPPDQTSRAAASLSPRETVLAGRSG